MKFTLLLIAINILVFLYTLPNIDYYLGNYGFNVNSFLAGKYYLSITSIFLHFDWSHLIGNMLALLFLGGAVESQIKGTRYLIIYLIAGILGCFTAFIPIFEYSPDAIFAGASAAISGIIGIGIFISPGKWTFNPFTFIIPIPFIIVAALYFILNGLSLFDTSGIAYPAHLAGMFTGMVFGLFWGEKRMSRFLMFIFLIGLILAIPLILSAIL